MNVTYAAHESYQRRKSDPLFKALLKETAKKLTKFSDLFKKVKYLHTQVDHHMSELLSEPIVSQNISCKKGCSACCHTQVTVTNDEAEFLAQKVLAGHIINKERLYIQKSAANDSDAWYRLPYQARGCVFLDSEGACTVYEDRPSVCRTNYVLSHPSLCETKDGREKPVRLLLTEKADMVLLASFTNAKQSGALPIMLWNALTNTMKCHTDLRNTKSTNLDKELKF